MAWWRFQDGRSQDGQTAREEEDRYPGIYKSGVALEAGVPETNGRAARFDGQGAHLVVSDAPDFHLEDISVEFWVKSSQPWEARQWPGSATLVSKASSGAASGDWTINAGAKAPGVDPGRILVNIGARGGGTDAQLASPRSLNDEIWHHVVWTRERGGQNTLYVDGQMADRVRDCGGDISNDRPLLIGGGRIEQGGSFLDGLMAEVALYPKALSSKRVQCHYEAACGDKTQDDTITRTERPREHCTMKNRAGLEWRIEERSQGWALGSILLRGKAVEQGVTSGLFSLRNLKTGEERWLTASKAVSGDGLSCRLSGQDTVEGVGILFEMDIALEQDLTAASFTARWSVDKPLTGWELCLAYHQGFDRDWRCQLYPWAGNSESLDASPLRYCGVPASLLYRPDLSLVVLFGTALSFDYLNPTTWTGATGFHFKNEIVAPQFRVGGRFEPGIRYEVPLQLFMSDSGESDRAVTELVRAWIQVNHYEVSPLSVRSPEQALQLFMEGRRRTTSWRPGIGYRLQDAPGVHFVYLGTTPASAYLEYRLYEETGDGLWRDRCFTQMDTLLRAQNLDPQSPHFGAIHTAYDYEKEAFDSDDRGANRGWKPDIVAHMVRYMLLTWEEVRSHEGTDRQDWYAAAIRAGEWIVRQRNPDGGMPQVIWNDTGKASESAVCGRTLLALPVLSRLTNDPAYDECLKGMEAFLRKKVEGLYWFTGAHPDLWPNDYEQDSIWCVVEYWLDQYDRTREKACLDRAVADAYLSFLWWCPKQLSWVQRPTQGAHCEQQHYTQYSVYCYHNRKVECLDRLARATKDPLFRALADRVLQLNFATQLTEGDQTGAFSEAIADPWGERNGDFNFVGTPYMNELSLDMMLQIVDRGPEKSGGRGGTLLDSRR